MADKLPKVIPNGEVAFVVSKIVELYNSGKIDGIVVGIKLNDGTFETGFSPFSILEQLGLCSSLDFDIKYTAMHGDING